MISVRRASSNHGFGKARAAPSPQTLALSIDGPEAILVSRRMALSRAQAIIARTTGRQECARHEASCVDGWLAELTLSGPFAIDYRVEGAEHLVRTAADEAGILYCTVHVPLATVMTWACVELGAAPDCVIAAPHNINREGRWVPAGLSEGLERLRLAGNTAPGAHCARRRREVCIHAGRGCGHAASSSSHVGSWIGARPRRSLLG